MKERFSCSLQPAQMTYSFWSGGCALGCGANGQRVAVLLLNRRAGDRGDTVAGKTVAELFCAA
jgi:hypothetical protein